jgi:hypothetical protein
MEITFSTHKFVLQDQDIIRPYPAKKNVPNWYKQMSNYINNDIKNKTIKKCLPFLDTLTAGYIIPSSNDIKFEVKEVEGKKDIFYVPNGNTVAQQKGINISTHLHNIYHPVEQIGGKDSFLAKKNHNFNVFKFLSPWWIKTPPGYSCLFISPMNNENENYEIIKGIVDTDTQHEVNFPMFFKKIESFFIAKGDPVVQVIPFKRESWKMKIEERTEDEFHLYDYIYHTYLKDFYRKIHHKKKEWN